MPKPITLAEALINLRKDLETARQQAEEQDIKFTVKDVEVEFQIAVATEGSGELGGSFWVLHMKGGRKRSDQTTHKVKLSLKPELNDGGDVKVGGAIPSER